MTIERSSARNSTIAALAGRILELNLAHPPRIAVDGRTAAGKTTLAEELASTLRADGRDVIQASLDGFHHPSTIRYRQGRLSADGYYEDARDLDAVRERLLEPLGPNGDRRYVTQTFDLALDRAVEGQIHRASDDSVLIVDGTFLQRPELRPHWDFVIFLDVPSDQARRRGVGRDHAAMGGENAASEVYRKRYEPAFARYAVACHPAEGADVVIDNSDDSLVHLSDCFPD